MPYIEKMGVQEIKDQLDQWYFVMTDPNIDGFNGWGCKQKIYEVRERIHELLSREDCPTYVYEEKYLEELDKKRVWRAIGGK